MTNADPGSFEYFHEIESYRFDKLSYLGALIQELEPSGKRVLDVGCGLGVDTARLALAGGRVTGIDLCGRAIDLARQNFRHRDLSGEFHVMDGEAMTFDDASFDLVYCHTVLHFTPDPDRMIAEIHRVLRPGGVALLMAVNRRSWLRLIQRLGRVAIDHLSAPVFHWMTAAELARRCRAFDEVELRIERFPKPTRLYGGIRARLFNGPVVTLFGALPEDAIRWCGHHLIVIARKSAGDARA